jgi:hypothetical protein
MLDQISSNVARLMATRKTWVVLIVALIAAAVIGASSQTIPYNENLIRLQTDERLAPIDPAMAREPLDIQVILLNYSDDKALLLKAWVALSTYPVQSREVLGLYGAEAEFKDVLRAYGEAVVPIIKYFIDHDLLSLKVRETTGGAINKAGRAAKGVWNHVRGASPQNSSSSENAQDSKLDPTKRGRYAVQFIKDEGHQFLGQFVVDQTGTAKWNQTNRVTEGVASFFTGGISNLERKRDLNEELGGADVFFAAIDVIPFAVSLRLLKAGKLASAGGKELSVASRTRILAPRLIPKGEFFWKLGKYGAAAATAYVVIKHPGLINSLLAETASLLGLPAWLVQGGFWFVLVFLALYPFLWLLKNMAPAILFALSLMERARGTRSAGLQV